MRPNAATNHHRKSDLTCTEQAERPNAGPGRVSHSHGNLEIPAPTADSAVCLPASAPHADPPGPRFSAKGSDWGCTLVTMVTGPGCSERQWEARNRSGASREGERLQVWPRGRLAPAGGAGPTRKPALSQSRRNTGTGLVTTRSSRWAKPGIYFRDFPLKKPIFCCY